MTSTRDNREDGSSGANLPAVTTSTTSDLWTIDKVLATLYVAKPTEGSISPVPYFHILERLKTTKRKGWTRYGINQGESIADHMYRMSLMTMCAPPTLAQRLDLPKCMKMCLIHDLAESFVGDITPADGVPKAEKNRRESLTMDYITKRLLGNVHGGAVNIGSEINSIWEEHEDSQTLDSHFVQDLDKLELLLQMVEYEKGARGEINLSEFTYVATKISLPEMKIWADEILKERDEFWRSQIPVHDEDGKDSRAFVQTEKMRQMQDQYYDGK